MFCTMAFGRVVRGCNNQKFESQSGEGKVLDFGTRAIFYESSLQTIRIVWMGVIDFEIGFWNTSF